MVVAWRGLQTERNRRLRRIPGPASQAITRGLTASTPYNKNQKNTQRRFRANTRAAMIYGGP